MEEAGVSQDKDKYTEDDIDCIQELWKYKYRIFLIQWVRISHSL